MSFISIIIPCRNEEKFIENVLDSIIYSDYPLENLEIIIVDGLSNDKTRELIKIFQNQYEQIILIDNPEKTVPYAMNYGISQAKGEILIRLDAHAIYPKNYISQLVYYSRRLDADNVGGFLETLPANDSLMARSIALSLSSPFGVGNAEYRIQSNKDKEFFETDTVPFGCYKKEVFGKIGLYDEDLIRNQDNELNERLKKAGGKIYVIPSLVIKYYARENYTKLCKMMFQYGYFGPLVDMKLKRPTRLRRYIPAFFVLSLIIPFLFSFFLSNFYILSLVSFGLYFSANTFFSIKEANKADKILLAPYIFTANLISHMGYGIGYLKGLIDFPILKRHRKKIEIKLSR